MRLTNNAPKTKVEFRGSMRKVGIIGSGKWSRALSRILVNTEIIIKTRDIRKAKVKFSKEKSLLIVDCFEKLRNCDVIFLANTSQSMRNVLVQLPKNHNLQFVICSKGIERKTNLLMSEILKEYFPKSNFAVLSGPNFSFEVIKGLPTASVISSKNSKFAANVSKIIAQEKFRIYFNTDVIGTQIGGAMKNVVAIASGFIIGKGLGLNANASIITRGLSEIIELGIKMGAKKNTFYGLSGIGDLSLTCSSLKSRNTKLGYLLAQQKKIVSGEVVEGMESCESICKLGKKYDVELPICNSVKKILSGQKVNKIISNLLSRPLQYEK